MTTNVLDNYLDDEGRITRWPGKKRVADQDVLLAYLADQFEIGRDYTEREVNDLLKKYHTFGDWALLRRELFERGYVNRLADGTKYWRTPTVTFL